MRENKIKKERERDRERERERERVTHYYILQDEKEASHYSIPLIYESIEHLDMKDDEEKGKGESASIKDGHEINPWLEI